MFVSAGTSLKFHSLHDDTSTLTYNPIESGSVTSLSLSKDNGFLTFVTEKAKPEIISLKNLKNIKNIHTISSISGASSIAFERTTKRIIGIGTNFGQVALYDTKTKTINKLFQNAPCSINLLDFNVGDNKMAVSSANGGILIYDVKKTEIYDTYTLSNSCCPTAMRFHPNERRLLTVGAEDGTLIQWDVDTGQNIFSHQVHTASIIGAVAVNNSNFIVSVGYDHKLCIHDVSASKCVFRSNLQHPLTALDASCDGYTIAIGTLFGNLYLYDIRNLIQPISTTKPHNTRINKILFDHSLKDDFIEAIPEESPESCHVHREMPKRRSKFLKRSRDDRSETQSVTKDCFSAEDTSKDVPEILTEGTSAAVKTIKEDVSKAIYKGAEEIRFNLTEQLEKLQGFIVNEFRTIENDMEEKWDLRNLISLSSEDAGSKRTPGQFN